MRLQRQLSRAGLRRQERVRVVALVALALRVKADELAGLLEHVDENAQRILVEDLLLGGAKEWREHRAAAHRHAGEQPQRPFVEEGRAHGKVQPLLHAGAVPEDEAERSEEHTSELQSLA